MSSYKCMESNWRGLPARALFMAAVKHDDPDEFRQLLKDQPRLRRRVNDWDGDKCGIMHGYALTRKQNAREMIEAFVQAGGDINKRNVMQETPLQMAALYGHVNVVEALLECGARVDLADWKGDSPLPTAQKKCAHNGSGRQNCCRVLNLCQEAHAKMKDTRNVRKAEELRHRGNLAFQKGQYESARKSYTKSLEIWEDYRTFSNRAACSLQIAKNILSDKGRYTADVHHRALEVIDDAGKASKLKPDFEKARYRKVAGYMMNRDFPRAKRFAKEGLEACQESAVLGDLLEWLKSLEVPDQVSNPFCDCRRNALAELGSGADHMNCPNCARMVPLSYTVGEAVCPFCAMNLLKEVEEQDIIERLLKL